jgi:hypothetical protein
MGVAKLFKGDRAVKKEMFPVDITNTNNNARIPAVGCPAFCSASLLQAFCKPSASHVDYPAGVQMDEFYGTT